eukprot:6188099-Pleurochrysis_carterae.AAC.2
MSPASLTPVLFKLHNTLCAPRTQRTWQTASLQSTPSNLSITALLRFLFVLPTVLCGSAGQTDVHSPSDS